MSRYSKEDRKREAQHGAAIGRAVRGFAILWTVVMLAASLAVIVSHHV